MEVIGEGGECAWRVEGGMLLVMRGFVAWVSRSGGSKHEWRMGYPGELRDEPAGTRRRASYLSLQLLSSASRVGALEEDEEEVAAQRGRRSQLPSSAWDRRRPAPAR